MLGQKWNHLGPPSSRKSGFPSGKRRRERSSRRAQLLLPKLAGKNDKGSDVNAMGSVSPTVSGVWAPCGHPSHHIWAGCEDIPGGGCWGTGIVSLFFFLSAPLSLKSRLWFPSGAGGTSRAFCSHRGAEREECLDQKRRGKFQECRRDPGRHSQPGKVIPVG